MSVTLLVKWELKITHALFNRNKFLKNVVKI